MRRALDARKFNSYSAVISFGLAGGLDPDLRPGDAIVATHAVCEGRSVATDVGLRQVLRAGFTGAGLATFEGRIAGVDEAVIRVADKAALRLRSDAVAVDMESHLSGAFAEERGLPFAVVRVACDPAHRALPQLAAQAVKPDGGVDIALVLRELRRRPEQLGDLIYAGLDARAAFATLRRCGGLISPLLGLVLAPL